MATWPTSPTSPTTSPTNWLTTLAEILADQCHPIYGPARYVLDPILPRRTA
jgi:hypothetical protein